MKVKLLYFDGCPNHEVLRLTLRQALRRADITAEIELRRIDSIEQAERERFLGSPTLRIDGLDVDPGAADRRDYGMKCRLYRSARAASGVPPESWIAAAIDEARSSPAG